MTVLIIARHGNTFAAGEAPRRVGRRTDIPLTTAGEAQARALGANLHRRGLVPDAAWCGTLARTRRTARLALDTLGAGCPLETLTLFDEIDYGPDEGQPEAAVLSRLGAEALERWEKAAEPPPGWRVDPEALVAGWHDFAAALMPGTTTFVATSNGIARFAPALAEELENFGTRQSLKLATGAYGILRHGPAGWTVAEWNTRP